LVVEILEHCSIELQAIKDEYNNSQLKPADLLKEGASKSDSKDPKKIYMYLFTNEGKRIKNVIDIGENIQYLLVSETKHFKDVSYKEIAIDTNAENHESIKMKLKHFKDGIT
jgi:hypothetical protein